MRPKDASCCARTGRLPCRAAPCAWTAPTRATKPADWPWNLGFTPVVPPNPNRVEPWEYDRVTYRRRNEVERLFRRLKGYRRIFTRYDKLDVLFLAFVQLALIFDALR